MLSDSFVGDANRLARLQREAESLAALNHVPFGRPVELFRGEFVYFPENRFARSYDVGRDGRFLILLDVARAATEGASIVVVENWFEELKERFMRPQ